MPTEPSPSKNPAIYPRSRGVTLGAYPKKDSLQGVKEGLEARYRAQDRNRTDNLRFTKALLYR